jgi:hypothetical protein
MDSKEVAFGLEEGLGPGRSVHTRPERGTGWLGPTPVAAAETDLNRELASPRVRLEPATDRLEVHRPGTAGAIIGNEPGRTRRGP